MSISQLFASFLLIILTAHSGFADDVRVSGYIGSHHLTFTARAITSTTTYTVKAQPDYIAITEVYPDTASAVDYRYVVSAQGIDTFERSHKGTGFGPVTYFIKIKKQALGVIRISGAEKSPSSPVRIASVRGVYASELKALLKQDDFKIMGLIPNRSIADKESLADQLMSNIHPKPEYKITRGISCEIPYANTDPKTLQTHIAQCEKWASKYQVPIFLGLVSWWIGTPGLIPDGAGGKFGDIKYQQICYSPDVEMPENPELKALLGARYNTHYGLTVPNQWSNTPWLTMNSDVLNQYRFRSLHATLNLIQGLGLIEHAEPRRSAKNSSWIYGFYLENEPRYWDTQMEGGNPKLGRQGKEVWADFNPMVIKAARMDGVDLNPADALSQRELLWLHRNVGRYNQATADKTLKSLAGRSKLEKLPVYTHVLQFPSFTYPAGQINHPACEWGYANGARTGIEGIWTQPSTYDRIREWGKWANLNREESDGMPIEMHLWDLRVTYMMGADLYNSYNWQMIGAQRFFDYVNEFLKEFPVVSLPPASAELTGPDSISIAAPLKLQAFTHIALPVLVARAIKGSARLTVTDPGHGSYTSLFTTIDLKPGHRNIGFDFSMPAECILSLSKDTRKAVVTLCVYDRKGDPATDSIQLTIDSATNLRLSLDLKAQRALSLWVIDRKRTL